MRNKDYEKLKHYEEKLGKLKSLKKDDDKVTVEKIMKNEGKWARVNFSFENTNKAAWA